MTLRAKPVVKRTHKPSWESQDRRNFYLNIGFGILVLAAVVILAIAVGASYYNDHLASVGSVDGESISKDELRDRALIETWRLDEADRKIRTQTVAGYLTEAQAETQQQILQQQREQLIPIALERIIDNRIQGDLAVTEGVTVTDADIDARLAEEATTPESRHAWVIEVAPEVAADAVEPSAAQIAAAKAKAETALRDLQDGKAWEDVAKTVSTDASTAPQAGDLSWLQAEDSQADEAFLEAVFAAEPNVPTALVEGADGIFRIGRVTEIAPESVDGAYTSKLTNDGIDLVKYREVVRGDVIRQKLEDKVVAAATQPGPQREVAEIVIVDPGEEVTPAAVKVRHILYSPKDDPQAASDGDIPETDPSWAAAEADARAAYEKIKTDPSLFDATARTESDEGSARGVEGSGGKLPGYVTQDSGYIDEFKAAVLAPGLTDGQILEPFKTAFGWHVVQIMHHPTDVDWLNGIKADIDAGADFAALARENSDADTSGRGGEVGWVAKGQLDDRLTAAIFDADIGKTTDVVVIADGGSGGVEDGVYLYKVLAEEVRTPEGRQLDELRGSAFSDWYTPKKSVVTVTRDGAITGAGPAG